MVVLRYVDLDEFARTVSVTAMSRPALLTVHFAPSNLVGGHRARPWSRYLPSSAGSPSSLPPIRHATRSGRPGSRASGGTRPGGDPCADAVDVANAAGRRYRRPRLLGLLSRVGGLAAQGKIDSVLVTIRSSFLAPLGRLVQRRHGAVRIDYQDPWINRWPGIDVPFSRAWASYRLASSLEPWAVRAPARSPAWHRAITGMLERNPSRRDRGRGPHADGHRTGRLQARAQPRSPAIPLRTGRRSFPHDLYWCAAAGGIVVLDAFLPA